MTVRRRRDRDRWIVDFWWEHPDGTRERILKASPVNTRRGAEEYERQLRDALLKGLRIKDGTPPKVAPTLNEFKEPFLEWSKVSNKPSEHAKKTQLLNKHLLPRLGKLRLDQVTAAVVREYAVFKLGDGEEYAAKTVNNHLSCLSSMLNEAMERGLLLELPRIRMLPIGEQKFDWLTIKECSKLLEHAEEWRPHILVAARTGLRLGELRALCWQDIDLAGAKIRVERAAWERSADEQVIVAPKNWRFRTVPITDEVGAVLRELPSRFRKGLVFPDNDGEHRTVSAWEWGLTRTCGAAKLREVGWHVLRHTYASHLAQAGVPILTIAGLLGHSDVRVTQRYAHLSPGTASAAAEALPPLETSWKPEAQQGAK